MPKTLQPMLADNKIKIDASILPELRYPLFASPKYDGLRLRIDPQLGGVSRTHKPLPNQNLQAVLAFNPWLKFFDGELIIGEPTAPDVFQKTQSAFMTHAGSPEINYYVFDHWEQIDIRYDRRLERLRAIARDDVHTMMNVHVVTQRLVTSPEEVLAYEEECVTAGYEGLILRSIDGKYKNGRSTFKEGLLLKFKRRQDAEATIVGFEALQRNNNPVVRDSFGYAKRSSHKAGKVDDNLLGAFVLEHPTWGRFNCGSGLDEDTRHTIWLDRDSYLGKKVSFTYTPAGMKDKPRFPIFKGIRND